MIDIIEEHHNSSSIAIYQDDLCISYKELNNKVNNFFVNLQTSTICLIIGSNTINTIAFYIACLRRECIPLLLSPSMSKYYLDIYIKNYKPTYIFSEPELINGATGKEDYTITELVKTKLKSRLIPSLLLTTSGSTGNPKVVKITKKNLVSNTKDIINYLKINNNSRHITTLPINYTYGLSCINTHLFSGGSIILNNYSIIQKDFWDLVNRYNPSSISGVPYTYELLYRLGLSKLNLESIKIFTQAGGKLSPEILKHFFDYCNKHGKEFIVMYGQTEATARMSYLPYKNLKAKLGSIGLPVPSGSFTLVDTSKYDSISNNKVGELVYKGPNVSAGYAENFLDLEISGEEKQILYTGDLAYIDKEGFTYLCGRKKRFAKLNGIRVSLDDVESCINVHIKSIAISDDKFIHIFIERNDEIDDTLMSKLKESLKNFNIPIIVYKFKIIDSFPRSQSGKIKYSEMLKS